MTEQQKSSQGQASNFDLLKKEVITGLSGKNNSIPIGFSRLDKHIGIRKRVYSVIMGSAGSGKSSLLHSAYILSPIDWYLKEGEKEGIKLKIILFSMERSKLYTIAKWVSRKIFLDQGVVIPVGKMLGWWNEKMSHDEHDLFLMYEDYVDRIDEIVTIYESAQNPTGIWKVVKQYALDNGKEEKINEFQTVYTPNHPNEIVIVATDHAGITKTEGIYNTKKLAIDKLSEYNQIFRDKFGYTPVMVSQLNRELSQGIYQKLESFEPTLDSMKETGRIGEDVDVAISLFDPLRYRTNDPIYDANRFVDTKTGNKYFRSIKVLKNTYGADDLRVGVAFHGATGIYTELPQKQHLQEYHYEEIFNGSYFLK